jgi:hypothetical protein
VIFDGEAQFTIDGRTAVLKGPAGALCRMGIHTPSTTRPTNRSNGARHRPGLVRMLSSFVAGFLVLPFCANASIPQWLADYRVIGLACS